MPFFQRTGSGEGKQSKVGLIFNIFSLFTPVVLTIIGFFYGLLVNRDFLTLISYNDFHPTIYFPIIVFMIVSFIWIIVDYRYVNHRMTHSKAIEVNATWSIILALVYTAYCSYSIGCCGSLEWFVLVPAISSVADGFASTLAGIDNATQKPFLGGRDGTS